MTEKGKIVQQMGSKQKGFWGGCRSLLVPLMIAVFTITTTVLQMNATRQINEQNLKIAIDNRDIANYTRLQQLHIEEERRNLEREISERRREADKQDAQQNRERDLRIANETRLHQIEIEEARLEQERRIEDQRRGADFQASENRQMDSILALYLKEMSEYLLTENFTLENRRWAIVVRAKTLTVLRQLDGRRKSYVVQFLYEAELLYRQRHPLDLLNADLNNIDMSGRKLNNISLVGASLLSANFAEGILIDSDFTNAKLTKSTFENAKLNYAIFYNCEATVSNFNRASLTEATFKKGSFIRTTWRNVDGLKNRFDNAVLDDADFSGATLASSSFYNTSLLGVSFNRTFLNDVDWTGAAFLGADLLKADLRGSNITWNQLYQSFSYDEAKLSNQIVRGKTNLLTAGHAEHSTNKTQCSTYGWNADRTMTTRTYPPHSVAASLGLCFFTGIEGVHEATMRQNVTVKFANISHIATYSRCRELIPEDEFKIQFQISQFDANNRTVAITNYTTGKNDENREYPSVVLLAHSEDKQQHYEKKISYNRMATRVEFKVTFKRQLQAPTNQTFGYCDNLRLFMYNSSAF